MAVQSFDEWKKSTMNETIIEKPIEYTGLYSDLKPTESTVSPIVLIGLIIGGVLILGGLFLLLFRLIRFSTKKLKGLLVKPLDFKKVILLLIFLWFVFFQFYPFLVRVGCGLSNKKYFEELFVLSYDKCIHTWGLK